MIRGPPRSTLFPYTTLFRSGDRGEGGGSSPVMKPPIRVLIVEDHFLARIALNGVLDAQSGFQIVGETGVGEDAVRLYREHRPDVVIMDLKLIGVSGFDAIEIGRASCRERE